MITDKQIVKLFLTGYAKATGTVFVKIELTDEVVRDRPAVDAAATDESGRTFLIEHTILEPFPGQKETLDVRMESVFEPLKRQQVPGRNIIITVPDNSVKRGQSWVRVAAAVESWFGRVKNSFPLGWSSHMIPALDSEVHIAVECVAMAGHPGIISIMYAHPQMKEQLVDAVARSVERKIEKLVKPVADRRIMLFQREWLAYTVRDLDGVLDSLAPRFPKLAQLDEIWLVDSVFRKRHGYLAFRRVRPKEWSSSASFHTDCE
jgi:hypothetical protein